MRQFMQRVLCLLLLLIWIVGCGVESQPQGVSHSEYRAIGIKSIQVDQKSFSVVGAYSRESDELEFFHLIICPPEDPNARPETYPGMTYMRDYVITRKAGKEPTASFRFYSINHTPEIVSIPLALNTVHFVDNYGTIVWSKTATELGIELSDVTSEEIIRPILESLIREHINTQEEKE